MILYRCLNLMENIAQLIRVVQMVLSLRELEVLMKCGCSTTVLKRLKIVKHVLYVT